MKAAELIGAVAAELMDAIEDLDEGVEPQAALVILAYSAGTTGHVRFRCSEASWWVQLGLLHGAVLAAEGGE